MSNIRFAAIGAIVALGATPCMALSFSLAPPVSNSGNFVFSDPDDARNFDGSAAAVANVRNDFLQSGGRGGDYTNWTALYVLGSPARPAAADNQASPYKADSPYGSGPWTTVMDLSAQTPVAATAP